MLLSLVCKIDSFHSENWHMCCYIICDQLLCYLFWVSSYKKESLISCNAFIMLPVSTPAVACFLSLSVRLEQPLLKAVSLQVGWD